MAFNVGRMAGGVALLLIGVYVTFILFNNLFTPTNTAATTLCSTLTTAGYSDEGSIATQSWRLYLLAIPIGLMASGVAFIVASWKGMG
jgi:hypothetical protein